MSAPTTLASPTEAPLMDVRRATIYFAVVYFSQGICQLPTLLNQPVRNYLKGVGYGADDIARFVFVATVPWMIKPAYGLLTDFFPLFGYRRKSYLLILSLVATVAFALVLGVKSAEALLVMMVMTGVSVAASDVVVDAMMVQAGQESGRTRLFQGAQWFSLNLAAIGSGVLSWAILGKWQDRPEVALKVAAGVAMGVPVVVGALTWWMVRDRRAAVNVPEFKATAAALGWGLVSPRVWVVIAFIVLIKFNPGPQTPLYKHLETKVGLAASDLAMLDMCYSVGQVVGSIVFMTLLSGRISTKKTTVLGLIIGAAGLIPLAFITSKGTAQVAYAVWGATEMLAVLSQLTVAAEACPKRVEAVMFASLMSVWNLSVQYSDVLGAKWYEGVMGQNIQPLILISAGFTLAGLALVPLIRGKVEEEAQGFEPVMGARQDGV